MQGKRTWLSLGAWAAAVASMALLAGAQALAAPVRVRVVSEFGIHTEAWKTQIQPFEEKTGIDVVLEQVPYANYLDYLTLNFTSGRPAFDVAYVSMLWYPSFATAGYLEPLDGLLGDAMRQDMPGIVNAVQQGHLYFIPYMNELGGIVYRTDLFNDPKEKAAFRERYGYELAPPRTLAQYRDVAEFFHRPPKLYGVTLMGKRSIFLATHFLNRLWAYGGKLLDERMHPAFDGPEGLRALNEVKEMFQFANPAAYSYDFQEALTEFSSGRSAMAELWTTGLFYANDPKSSKIAGKASFVGFPRPDGQAGKKLPMLYISWGFVVSARSPVKEQAIQWVQHVTGTAPMIAAAPVGNIPARLSALRSPVLQGKMPWLGAFEDALSHCVPTPMVPLIPEGPPIVNEAIAPAVSSFLSGEKGADQALRDAAAQVDRMMKDAGYY